MQPEAAEPSAAIAAFAQQLGIRPDEDVDFGWLAEVGLQSPLPPRWTSHEDASTGFLFYVDHDRQVSSWENPLVPHLRRIVEIGRAYLEKRSEDFFEEQKGILWHQHKHDLDCWHGPFADPSGRSYYVNSTAGISSWQDPRVDAQYIFELESGLLTTLAEVLPPPEADTPGWGDNTPWQDSNGAEVLTFEESTPPRSSSGHAPDRQLTRRLTQTMLDWSRNNNRDEHKSALDNMSQKAEWLRSAQQDEKEAQKLQIQRKVEERKKRQRRAARAARRSPGVKALHRLQSTPLGPLPGQQETVAEYELAGEKTRPGLWDNIAVNYELSPSAQAKAEKSLHVAVGRMAPKPLEIDGGDTPDGPTPTASPTGVTPAGTPAGSTPAASPLPSPANASAAPQPPALLPRPEPPPPEPIDPKPSIESKTKPPGTESSLKKGGLALRMESRLTHLGAREPGKESTLFAKLAAAAPA